MEQWKNNYQFYVDSQQQKDQGLHAKAIFSLLWNPLQFINTRLAF